MNAWSQLSDVEVQQSIVLQWMQSRKKQRIEHIGRLDIHKDKEYPQSNRCMSNVFCYKPFETLLLIVYVTTSRSVIPANSFFRSNTQ